MKLKDHLVTYIAIAAVFAGIFAIGYVGERYTEKARGEAADLLLEALGLAAQPQTASKQPAPVPSPKEGSGRTAITEADRNKLADGLNSLAATLESYRVGGGAAAN